MKAEEDWITANTMMKRRKSDANGIFIGMNDNDLETLSGYAVAARYPSADPTKEDMQEALHIAKTIRKFARAFLGLK